MREVDRHFVRYHKTGSLHDARYTAVARARSLLRVRRLGHTACAASGWPTTA
jgi:hypothetical protein